MQHLLAQTSESVPESGSKVWHVGVRSGSVLHCAAVDVLLGELTGTSSHQIAIDSLAVAQLSPLTDSPKYILCHRVKVLQNAYGAREGVHSTTSGRPSVYAWI
jgi:hypothetical protein